ncbi:MAG: haloalkane dehalogenase [Alphaproteobacteria bacterium]|jgi:haloalkane dehalogenase
MNFTSLRKPAVLGLAALAVAGSAAASAGTTPSLPMENGIEISAAFPYERSHVEVNGSQMAYVDVGEGPVVLFLHGNPTSSYLWRNIIPYVADDYRVIALDLIGMGDSDKPEIGYTFADHADYLDGFITALDLRDITLVVHDWGSALGMRYARLNEDNVRGIALMEALLPPAMPIDGYAAMGVPVGPLFQALRTPGLGEELVLGHNFFVESVLGRLGAGRVLSEDEMAEYRRPYPTAESRLPTLVWPRQIPIGGEPADVARVVEDNGVWFYATPLPKLFFHAQPGALIPPPAADYIIATAPNLRAVDLGAGNHFVQESSPHAIGAALSAWLADLAS